MASKSKVQEIEEAMKAQNTELPANIENNPDEPIMVVLTDSGLVHWAGQPKKPTANDSREWFQPGWQVITMSIKQFREANFKWIYDKPHTNDKR